MAWFLQISFTSALIKDSWILISASAFNLLQYVVLAAVPKENQSHRYVAGKDRNVFLALSDNCGYYLM